MRTLLVVALAALPALAQREGSFQRTLSVSGPVELEVSTHSGRIAVRAGGAGAVDVRATIRARRAEGEKYLREVEANPPIVQEGNTIRITSLRDEEIRRHLSIDYEVTAPAETRLRANSGSGGVTIQGLRGPVHANTGSGRIELSAIQEGATANTGSGGITGAALGGAITARSGSGDVRIEQTTPHGVSVVTGSGEVEVKLPASGGFDLKLRTGSGQANVTQPIALEGGVNHGSLRGKIRGGGIPVEITTGSGSIRIL